MFAHHLICDREEAGEEKENENWNEVKLMDFDINQCCKEELIVADNFAKKCCILYTLNILVKWCEKIFIISNCKYITVFRSTEKILC